MRFYNTQLQYYCGGDLHARTLFLHILDSQGKTCYEKNLPASPQAFLDAVTPFREGLVVGVECMFAWYWLADLCEAERIPFVLGHALAMKAIHGRVAHRVLERLGDEGNRAPIGRGGRVRPSPRGRVVRVFVGRHNAPQPPAAGVSHAWLTKSAAGGGEFGEGIRGDSHRLLGTAG